MENTAALALLIGAILPAIISVLKQLGWPKWANLLVAILSSALAGFLTVLVRGELDWSNLLVASALTFTAAQAVYGAYWRDSGVDTRINDATSLVK
jgi:ABC-type uncharacterized transport system permease subunit